MAKLGAYYGLCPIIDEKSLLGINEDVEVGNVIVTLGKNIAIKYKLADQKQLISWRTKDKFTSPVIYFNEEGKYCAIFNQSYVRTWFSGVENLDKQKKFKLNKQIFTLLKYGQQSFIVFANGAISLLSYALENRKVYNPPDIINPQSDTIIDILNITVGEKVYIGLIVESDNGKELVWTSFVSGKFDEFARIPLHMPLLNLVGSILTSHMNGEVHLLSLWSDGRMWLHPLEEEDKNAKFYSLIKSFSFKHQVTMTTLNNDYIAMYGADHNQEGASLIVYNKQFQTLQSKQAFKMFRNTTKLWCLQNNLFLCIGQNLAVVPYHLDMEQLAALVGSHRAQILDDDDIEIVQEVEIVDWENKKKPNEAEVTIQKDVSKLCTKGWSEYEICLELIPKYIEKNNVKQITSVLKHLTDIPELCIIQLLNYVLNANSRVFKAGAINDNIPKILSPMSRCLLIDDILMQRFSDVLLLPHIRMLALSNSLTMLRYISYLLSENSHLVLEDKEVLFKRQLLNWGCIIMDANYQKLLMTADDQIIETVKKFASIIDENLNYMNNLLDLDILINEVKSGQYRQKKIVKHDSKYSMEKIKLY